MAETQTADPAWSYNFGDVVPGTPVEEYRQIVGELSQQFAQEYPDVAARTFILDPSRPTSEQLEAFMAGKQGLTEEAISTLRQEVAAAQDILYANFRERASDQGRMVALTSTFEIGGETYRMIIPPPADRMDRNSIIETIAHELNHAITVHAHEELDPHHLDPHMVQAEWSAVLAEYSYMLAQDPSRAMADQVRLNHVSRVVALGNLPLADTDVALAGKYPYVPSEAAFNAMVEATRERIARGEAPSLHLANEVAQQVMATHGPAEATIQQDSVELRQIAQLRAQTEGAAQTRSEGLSAFHDSLGQQTGRWGQRLALAQDEKTALMNRLFPNELVALQNGTAPEINADAPARSSAVDQYEGIANVETLIEYQTAAAPDASAMIGYDARTGEAILGIDQDDRADTGQNGYDVFLRVGRDGGVSRSETLEAAATPVHADANAQAFYQQARTTLEHHDRISGIDLEQLKVLGAALGNSYQEESPAEQFKPGSSPAQQNNTSREASL